MDADALAHSAALSALIRSEIGAGSIGFERYMELALYAPGLGYYSAGARKFGAAGDFVTAPELGPAFARVLAHAFAPLLHALAEPTILELGGGSGALAAELLRALHAQGLKNVRYLLLDRSADLRARQAERLAQFDVQFVDAPPAAFDGIVLGNEIIDALPVNCFRIGSDDVVERAVGIAGDALCWRERPAPEALRAAVRRIEHSIERSLPHGYCSEVLLSLPAFIRTIAAPLRHGVVVLIDYGYGRAEYYRPERNQGTLICHHRHRAHDDPFFFPGLNDISAFVDFTALAEALDAAGLELTAYDTQSGFLLHQDLPRIFAELAEQNDIDRLALTGALKRLMLPGEMGERFKVMVAARSDTAGLERLKLAGQRHLL